jgi:Tfp pilus assembly protein PilN
MRDIKVQFMDWAKRDLVEVLVQSALSDAFEDEDAVVPDEYWLTKLAEDKLGRDLDSYDLDGYHILN